MFKDCCDTKQHKTLFVIIGAIVIFVILVVGVLCVVGIVNKIKEHHYIGRDAVYGNMISFTGEGKVYAKPDIALITLSVVTDGATVASVQDKNTKKMNSVIDFLKKSGIEDKDIKTTNYQLYPQYNYNYNSSKVPQIIGYQITQSVEVKIRNLDKVGEILEGSVDAGVNQVFSLYFKVDQDEALKSQARELAITDAKKKAVETAQQLGIRLGKLSGFTEGSSYPTPYPVYEKAAGMGGGGATPDIQTGENEILVNVTLTYEID